MQPRDVFATEDRPRIVVVGEGEVRAAGRLAPLGVVVVDACLGTGVAPPPSCDVLVVVLSGTSLVALEWALARWSALGQPELVFVCGQLTAQPFGEGLGAAGVRYVVSEAAAADWLLEHGRALADFTRARRALGEAARRLPPSPDTAPDSELPLGLFQAEQKFRSTYIRLLLARSATRREAADKARVAYRTFCHILEKLGISSRKARGQELAIPDDPSVSLTENADAQNHHPGESPSRDERIL
jgi:hypothetical protein